ncbi:MAG: hypothetical protein Q9202_007407 [Teloschistes flavicans]
MAQEPTFFILKSLLHLPASEADLLLGRIVKNFKAPWTGSAPKNVSNLTEGFLEGHNKDFKLEKQTSKNVSLKMRLQGLLGINLIGSLDSCLDLEGKKIMFKLLRDPDLVFDKLKKESEVQRRVPGWIKIFGPPACLVTGLLMYEDTLLTATQSEKSEASLEGEIPTAQLATGTPLAVSNIKAEAEMNHGNSGYFQGHSSDRKIFALGLQVVTTGLIHRERLRLKDEAPQMPNERQLAGETDGADEASEDDDSGPELVGSKKEQQRRKAEMDIAGQMETLPVSPDEWDELYDSYTGNN